MPFRPGFAAVVATVAILPLGCGDDEPTATSPQGQRSVTGAGDALGAYDESTVVTGAYAGATSQRRGARLRISRDRGVRFSIRARCGGQDVRVFSDRPSRLRQNGTFAYREQGPGHQLVVRGVVSAGMARGTLGLASSPGEGRGCRLRLGWRAERR